MRVQLSSQLQRTNKPRVLFCVLTGTEPQRRPCVELTQWLLRLAPGDPRFDLAFHFVKDHVPYEAARNAAVKIARDNGATWLVQYDNDNFPRCNPLDVIAAAGPDQKIVGSPYGVGSMTRGYAAFPPITESAVRQGPFADVEALAGGTLMIHHSVWEQLPAPLFKWCEPTEADPTGQGEDIYFSRKAKAAGFRLWAHEVYAGHWKTVNVTDLAATCKRLSELEQANALAVSGK